MIGSLRLRFRVLFRFGTSLTFLLRWPFLLVDGGDEVYTPALLLRLHDGLAARYMTDFLYFLTLLLPTILPL